MTFFIEVMISIDKNYRLLYELIFTLLAIIAVIITLLYLTETIVVKVFNPLFY